MGIYDSIFYTVLCYDMFKFHTVFLPKSEVRSLHKLEEQQSVDPSGNSNIHRITRSILKPTTKPELTLAIKRIAQIMIHPCNQRHSTQVRAESCRNNAIPTARLWRMLDIKELDRTAVVVS